MTRLRIWSTMPASWVAISTVVPVRLIRSSSFMMPDRGGRVEVAGGLVGDQDHRPVDERAGDRDPLLLAAGELVGHPVALALEADQLEGLGDHLVDRAARGLPITCSANATFSATVLFGSSRKSWKTVPIWRRSRGTFQLASRLISLPAT